DEQITELRKLEERYPIYGIKINPVAVQSKATALLDAGKPFLDFAVDRNIPFVFHSTTVPNDIYSQASDILRIAETRTDLRFCLAHALIFNKRALDIAHELENVWVDTAALKIQVDVVNQLVEEGVLSSNDLLDADFSDHRLVMKTLCEKYPDTILWGSDSPAYSFHCVRAQGDGNIQNFAFLGKYEDEIAAINALAPDAQERVSNINTLNFLFGRE
ncbi:MAG: amidohydrolase family protein, partial [Victivallales bacterium]|nr:amidohydrolase family protein [Victivallales bacterium]